MSERCPMCGVKRRATEKGGPCYGGTWECVSGTEGQTLACHNRELARKDRVIEELACGMAGYGKVLHARGEPRALATVDAVMEWAEKSADHAEVRQKMKIDTDGKEKILEDADASRLIQEMKAANDGGCRVTALQNGHTLDEAENCDDGSVGCPDCPFKKGET